MLQGGEEQRVILGVRGAAGEAMGRLQLGGVVVQQQGMMGMKTAIKLAQAVVEAC